MSEPLVRSIAPNWETTTLGALCAAGGGNIQTGPFGSQLHASDYVATGIPSVMPQNIGDNVIREEGIARITPADAARLSRYLLQANDIVYSRRGDVKRRAFIQPSQEGWLCGTGCLRVRIGKSANARFISYYLGHPIVHEWIERHAIGATMLNLNTKILSSLPVTCPPIPEQDAIAEILSALDDKILLNEQMRETSLGLASALYASVECSNEPVPIGTIADIFDGPHATPQKVKNGPWFLSISSLKNGYLALEESAHLSEDDFSRWTRRVQPQSGDVLFSYETRLGSAALMAPRVRGSLGRRMALLRSKAPSVSGALLLHAYLRPAFQEEIRRRTIHGATVDRLPLSEMSGWPIKLPAKNERAWLSARLDSLHTFVVKTAAENRTVADLRDTLLPRLLSGEARIRDAEKVVEDAV